jgi:YD repeat-containing protein
MKQMQRVITKKHSEHKMIIMIDMGDLRDGINYKNLSAIDEILKNIENELIIGIATNLGCFGGVIPDKEIMDRFSKIAEYVKSKNKNIKIISGGNTTTLPLIENKEISNIINQFRVGEAILLGSDVTRNKKIDYLDQNTMFLEAELIEVQEKANEDNIKLGYDAFGRKKEKTDRKKRKRGIVYMGEIDIIPELTKPVEEDIEIIGSSSDQTVLDLSNSHHNYKTGDTIRFKLGYGSMVKAITSPFVRKIYI